MEHHVEAMELLEDPPIELSSKKVIELKAIIHDIELDAFRRGYIFGVGVGLFTGAILAIAYRL